MKQSVVDLNAQISAVKIMDLIGEMLGGIGNNPNPDGDGPSPDGPWGPYIRQAVSRVSRELGIPTPEPAIFGLFSQGVNIAALNPQPLPPRIAFLSALSQEVIGRATLIDEVAKSIGQQRQVGGKGLVSEFTDDMCGSVPFRWPFPGPRPVWWVTERTGLDLLVLGRLFLNSAEETLNTTLQGQLKAAGTKFNEAGIAKMEA